MSARAGLALLGAALLAARPAAAHEEGVIHLEVEVVAVAGELGIQGAELPEETNLRLVLRGTLETYPLVEVRTDSAGEFRTRLALPAEARAGRYTVVAVAPDGDEVAEADLVVAAEAPGAPPPGAAPREPTAEAMELAAARSGGEWLAILLFVGLCAAGGVALLTTGRSGPAD